MRLIVDNGVHYDMTQNALSRAFVTTLVNDEDFYLAIQCATAYRTEIKQMPRHKISSSDEYRISSKIEDINSFIFECYAAVDDFEPAIADQKANSVNTQRDKEIDVYILIDKLFRYKQKEYILQELEIATKNGIKLRDSLLKLKESILTTGILPSYIR